jgi:hypothetical protein
VIPFTVVNNISEPCYQDDLLIQHQNLHNGEKIFFEKIKNWPCFGESVVISLKKMTKAT